MTSDKVGPPDPTPLQVTVSEKDTCTDVNVLVSVTADGRGEKGRMCPSATVHHTLTSHICIYQNSKSGVSQSSTRKGNRALAEIKNNLRSLLLKRGAGGASQALPGGWLP